MSAPAHVDIALAFPIERADKPAIDKLRLQRPKTGHVIEFVKLFGQDIAMALLSGDGEKLAERLDAVRDDRDALAAHVAALLAGDKIDGLVAILGGLLGLEAGDALKIDPADYGAIGKAFLDFFPALTGLTEKLSSSAPAT